MVFGTLIIMSVNAVRVTRLALLERHQIIVRLPPNQLKLDKLFQGP